MTSSMIQENKTNDEFDDDCQCKRCQLARIQEDPDANYQIYDRQPRKTMGYDIGQKRIERAKKMQMFMEATQNQKYSDFELYLAHIEKNFNSNNFFVMSNLNRQKAAFSSRIKNTKQINLMTQSSFRNSFLAQTKNISMVQPRTQSYLLKPYRFEQKSKENSPDKFILNNSLEFIQEEPILQSKNT
eukprot:TRINITY_DN5680_c0_g1_i1.p2 TRINITY_DN5680_c0_g1~~TRINITY_DN5680_c0_g1_i1.p2  ORF type:complete len:186 (+),score=28.71 TRINITY_DN5680_c0_g1_i1:422-979(+)